jgi:hypothetical protein
LEPVKYPWEGAPDYAACNFALGHLAVNVRQRLVVDGRLHAETLLVAIGAIAGFCAQCAVIETMIKPGKVQIGKEIVMFTSPSGEMYMFGDPLNSYLIHEVPGRLTLWSVIAGAAAQSGVPFQELPDYRPIFARVAASVREGNFGVVAASAGHAPGLQPLKALNLLWPLAKKCLTGKGLSERDWGQAGFEHWPAIASIAAAGYVSQVKDVLDPRISLALVMEAAIIASKVRPANIVEGSG